MINSRSLFDLLPEVQPICSRFLTECEARGLRVLVTSTYRDDEYQIKVLWPKGRTEPGPKVTWTKATKHAERRAWDIAILNKEGKPVWDAKVDVDEDEMPDYMEARNVGQLMGLTCGADYGDWCHFEVSREALAALNNERKGA